MALNKNLEHVDFDDARTVEQMHLAAYAAQCISELQRVGGYSTPYPKETITDNELSCIRHSFKLDEHTYNTYSSLIIVSMLNKGILIKGKVLQNPNAYGTKSILTYKLLNPNVSKAIALKYVKKPSKAAYRQADHHRYGVPISNTLPEYVVHIHEYPDVYDLITEGYYSEKARSGDLTKEQIRRYIRQYMGTSLLDFIKALKGEDLMKQNITRILELLKVNAPLLINNRHYEKFARIVMKNIEILDYDTLYGDK